MQDAARTSATQPQATPVAASVSASAPQTIQPAVPIASLVAAPVAPAQDVQYDLAFSALYELAATGKFADLITTAEDLDLSPADKAHPNRLLIITPLVLSYLVVDDLPPARHALSRLPSPLESLPVSQALAKLVASATERKYANIYPRAEELHRAVQDSVIPGGDLKPIANLLLQQYIETFRRKTFALISKAFTSIPLALVQQYLGCSEEQARLSNDCKWKDDPTRPSVLLPIPINGDTGALDAADKTSVCSNSDLEMTVKCVSGAQTNFCAILCRRDQNHVEDLHAYTARATGNIVQLNRNHHSSPDSAFSFLCIVLVRFKAALLVAVMGEATDLERPEPQISKSKQSDGVSVTTQAIVENAEVVQIADELPPEKWIHLQFSWSGKPYTLDIAESDRVYDLKVALYSLTNVPPERQKVLGLAKAKLPSDEVAIRELKLVTGKKFTLVGTPEGDEIKDPSQLEFLPDVLNDFDVDFSSNPRAADAYRNDQRNLRKIREHTQRLNLNIIYPLREGKRLLVLDIDYTILDTKPLTTGALPPQECARPRLHQFLEAVYPYYDICMWSQTSWSWLEVKLVELGMIVLDKTSMFTVFSVRDGAPVKHSVKALQIIWNHLPQYGAHNTIHVDDLGRNFALNPNQGLKISAFKEAHTPRAMSDRELDKLSRYMVHIATSHSDFSALNHKDWKDTVRSLPQ
ncbi:hypothetical protein NM688_g6107 [Phlebia brevispora]|uniref:Uncharacterized protein n=1 Tax=Phlebia brevispora TaxID=194682 RepID=A0ACC1SJS7_9APHY|nr:hypothetical protein NM688_g6107 [Phlebia brevispora]